MQVILIQSEIEEAIRDFVNKGIALEDKYLEVDLTAGRGSSGFTATIDIINDTGDGDPMVLPGPSKTKDVSKPGDPQHVMVDDTAPLFGKPVDAKAS